MAALASYRLTRLFVADALPPMEKLRDELTDRTPDGYDTLWACPWCLGFWVAAAVTGVAELADRTGRRNTFLLAAMPWAISAVVGAIAEREIN